MSIRLCGNPSCNQPRHTIRNCNHESVQILRSKLNDISNFCIGFNYRNFLKLWLKRLSDIDIKILSYSDGISNFSRNDNEVILFNIYYLYPIQSFIPFGMNIENLYYFKESARRSVSHHLYIQLIDEMVALELPVEMYNKKRFMISTDIVLKTELEIELEIECPICYDIIKQHGVHLNCSHIFCTNCLTKYFETIQNNPICALCRTTITHMNFNSIQDLGTINIIYLINDLLS